MKLYEYGLILLGYNAVGRFELSGDNLSKLKDYKFSYRKQSVIVLYKNGYRRIHIKFERGRIQVKFFETNRSVSILSYTEYSGFSGLTDAVLLLNTIYASVTKQLQTRQRNIEGIKEILTLIELLLNRMMES